MIPCRHDIARDACEACDAEDAWVGLDATGRAVLRLLGTKGKHQAGSALVELGLAERVKDARTQLRITTKGYLALEVDDG